MRYRLISEQVYRDGTLVPGEIVVEDGRIVSSAETAEAVELHDWLIVPGFVDVHVHLREPGFSYKETIATGTAAAAAGGYTAVCAMPNLTPVPDAPDTLQPELDAIRRDAQVRVFPYGSITRKEQGEQLSDMAGLAPHVIGFSDDGRGVQSRETMRSAMIEAQRLGKPIAAHCEDETRLLPGGCIHDGSWARTHGIPGIPSDSEWAQVERDLALVRETGCQYHVCHVSTKESVALIRQAKAEGLPVTCETAPHYLTLTDADLEDDGRFRMNPPIRAAEDRDALLEGLLDGTIDCIATDHAPHSAEEKSGGLRGSKFGIVGLETAFPVLYTRLVEPGVIPLTLLLDRLCVRPRRIFGLSGGALTPGAPADITVLDLHWPHRIDTRTFRSMGRATPFDGWTVSAGVVMTIADGQIVYDARIERGGL